MLHDDEFDQQGDRNTLKTLLKGGGQQRPSERFAHRLLKIESLLMHKLDENSRYVQLASWAIAGIHCSTRAEKETYDFYSYHMTDVQSMEQEDASLEMRLALILADLRKSLLSELVALDENERLHQIAHLEKKVAQPLALVGDSQDFHDHFQIVIKAHYKAMTPETLLTHVLQKYTVEKMAEVIVREVNKTEGSRLPFSVLNKAFQQRQALAKLGAFYNEDATAFTLEGAKALLYSTGYLEG